VSRLWRAAFSRRPAIEQAAWPDGSSAALSFSFDDGRASQVHRGLPLFDALDVRATFFVLPRRVRKEVRGWCAVVEKGHEIGNHSLRHPCAGSVSGRGLVLEQMTLEDIEADLLEANRQINELLGVDPNVFAYPCGSTYVGRGVDTQTYVPLVARMFRVGRTFRETWANDPVRCDVAQVACVNTDRLSFKELRPLLDSAVARGSWVVLGGHEIGGTASDSTSPSTVEAIVSWCRRERVRIGTVGAIAETVTEMQRAVDVSLDPARSNEPRPG
jgi:peptidoglycan/xylan/chitin deacetylase (PgdA/CDA1 family)